METAPSAPPAPASIPIATKPLGALLIAVVAAQLFAWSRLEGYQLADCVEYLDRAEAFSRGEPLDPGTARSFAFSALLVPVFWLERLIPGEQPSLPMVLARLLQMLFGLGAVAFLARWIGSRIGLGYGLAAGALLGCSPIFLRYSIAPLSSAAALFAITLGVVQLDRTLERRRGTLAGGLVVGAWFAFAILMAYQNVLLVGAIAPCLLFTRAWRRPAHLLGIALAMFAGYLIQGMLDGAVYGTFGSSLHGYLRANLGSQLGTLLAKLGLVDLAFWVYDNLGAASTGSGAKDVSAIRMLTPPTWYFDQLGRQFLVPVGSALLALGALAGLLRRRPIVLLMLFALVVNLVVMSTKGSKSFRLWMPFLAFFPAITAFGLKDLIRWGVRESVAPRWRQALAALAVLVTCAGGLRLLSAANLSKFGAYWRAIEQVNRESGGEPVVATSAYDWAARYREASNVELTKFPYHLDRWPSLEEDEQEGLLAALAERDYLFGHLQLFTQDPRIIAAVNREFEIAQVFHDYDAGEELWPVFLLRRRTGDPDAKTFFEIRTDTGPGEPNEPGRFQAQLEHPSSVDFRRREGDGVYQMVFLGFDVDPGLIDGTQAWITFHWYAGPLGDKNYRVVSRFTDGRGGGFDDNRTPTYGAYPTSRWNEGEIISTGFLSRVDPDPVRFGGPYRRGQSLPLELWLAVGEFDEAGTSVSGLNPFRPSAKAPVSKQMVEGGRIFSDEGRRFTRDGLMLVGGFFFELSRGWRVPDNGKPLPELPNASSP